MPRVHLKTKSKAGGPKTCVACHKPITVGQKYFEWAFFRQRPRNKHEDCGSPKQSELTNSKMSGVYAAIESAETAVGKASDKAELAEILDDVAQSARDVSAEYQEAVDAMGAAGESGTSAERVEALDSFADELDNVAEEIRNAEDEVEDEDEPAKEDENAPIEDADAVEKETEHLNDLRQRAYEILGELYV